MVALFVKSLFEAMGEQKKSRCDSMLAKMAECVGGSGGSRVPVATRCLAGGKKSENRKGERENVRGPTLTLVYVSCA